MCPSFKQDHPKSKPDIRRPDRLQRQINALIREHQQLDTLSWQLTEEDPQQGILRQRCRLLIRAIQQLQGDNRARCA